MPKKSKLKFPTEHLRHYEDLESIIKLQGEEYEPLRKAFWYQVFSLPFRQIKVLTGDASTDCRIHIAVPLQSGGGKKNLIRAVEKISREAGYDFVKPTHYHPEQLVGKVF